MLAGEQSRQSRQHRLICRLQRRSAHLSSENRHLVAQDHDLNREVYVTATDEADQLKYAAVRPVEERSWMLAALGASRQSPSSQWMDDILDTDKP